MTPTAGVPPPVGVRRPPEAATCGLLWTGDPNSTLSTALYAPMAIQEMLLALWLILRGFNSTALATTEAARMA